MNRFLIMMLGLLCIFSCRDESISESTENIPLGVDTNYQQFVYGQVLTTSGDPISNVLVSVKDDTYITDENGLFKFEDVKAGNKGTQISANKDGYLYGGYRLYAGEVGNSHVEIVLMEANNLGSINALVGGSIDVTDKSTVSFPTAAFTLNGSSYSGNVNVLGNWIDPTDDDMLRLNPGDLTGVNLDAERVVLTSYGMIGIELRSDSGEELEIAEGKMVELKYEIPESMLGTAPSTIPLWSFDEVNGVWVEEETATLIGNQYVGSVSHFTWWNTDIPNSVVEFCITLVNATTGQPMGNQEIKIINQSGYGCAWGITNARGVICGVLPENSELLVNVLLADNQCPEGNPSFIIGEYTLADSPVSETLEVAYNNDLIVNVINGNVTDCMTGNPVANASVLLEAMNVYEITLTDASGNYSQNLVSCEDIESLEITAVDFVSEVTGQVTLTNLSGGDHTADITMCDELIHTEWFMSSANGFVMLDQVVCKVKPFETIIISENGLDLLGMPCQTTGSCTGTYAGTFGTITDVQIDIEEFGNVGQAVKGTFSGVNQIGDQVTGNFNVERIE